MKKRCRYAIINDILLSALAKSTKYRIHKDTGLCYKDLQYYLDLLLKNNLIQKLYIEYRTTDKGCEYIKRYTKLELLV